MVARLLLFIKHRIPFVWALVDQINTLLFRVLHGNKMHNTAAKCLVEFSLAGYVFRLLTQTDLVALESLLASQSKDRLEHFQPHGFDSLSLRRTWSNPAFLMFGVFQDQTLIGYFFLRCFWNRKCFVGRMIDASHERKGIGRVMNAIMYHTAWRSGFRCMTTVSKHNAAVIRSHRNNPHVRILQELPGDRLMLEFLPEPCEANNL